MLFVLFLQTKKYTENQRKFWGLLGKNRETEKSKKMTNFMNKKLWQIIIIIERTITIIKKKENISLTVF